MLTSYSPSVVAMMREEDKDHKVGGKDEGAVILWHSTLEGLPSLPTSPPLSMPITAAATPSPVILR